MTARGHTVLQKALSLPDDDGADIAGELLANLDEAVDDPETVQTLWSEELEAPPTASCRASWAKRTWGPLAGASRMNWPGEPAGPVRTRRVG